MEPERRIVSSERRKESGMPGNDLLTTLNVNVMNLCKKYDKSEERMTAYMEKMDKRCSHQQEMCTNTIEKKLSSTVFWKFFWIFALLMFAFGSTITYNSIAIVKNSMQIEAQSKATLKIIGKI